MSVGTAGYNLQYQWFYSASVSSQVALEGETNSSLQLTNTQVSQSGKYWVEVSNAFGKVSSAYAELAVGLLPKITANPTTVPSRPYVGEPVVWSVEVQRIGHPAFGNAMVQGGESNPECN
jgi:hypothetical protein